MASAVENLSDAKRSSRHVGGRLQSERHSGPPRRTRATVRLCRRAHFRRNFVEVRHFVAAARRSGWQREGRGDDDGWSGDWRRRQASSASRVQSQHAVAPVIRGTCLIWRPAGRRRGDVFHILCPLNRRRRQQRITLAGQSDSAPLEPHRAATRRRFPPFSRQFCARCCPFG